MTITPKLFIVSPSGGQPHAPPPFPTTFPSRHHDSLLIASHPTPQTPRRRPIQKSPLRRRHLRPPTKTPRPNRTSRRSMLDPCRRKPNEVARHPPRAGPFRLHPSRHLHELRRIPSPLRSRP